MEREFNRFLEQSENLRPGYIKSLMLFNRDWELVLNRVMYTVHDFFKVIYNRISGTTYEINEQKFMDFVPGYLLIHILEYEKSCHQLQSLLVENGIKRTFYPILRNYSSDFIALDAESHEIYQIFHDDNEIYLIHKNPLDFLTTINDFYSKGAYFIDDDGYLDYDSDLEYEIGLNNNPEVDYWKE